MKFEINFAAGSIKWKVETFLPTLYTVKADEKVRVLKWPAKSSDLYIAKNCQRNLARVVLSEWKAIRKY